MTLIGGRVRESPWLQPWIFMGTGRISLPLVTPEPPNSAQSELNTSA